MNKVIIKGRLTKDIELRQTSNQIANCSFTVAVDRKYKDNNGQRQADFISCVAWRNTATFLSQYFHKGSELIATGELQTRTYDDNNGKKVYVTEVVVDDVEFCGSAKQGNTAPTVDADDGSSLEVPFEI